MTKAYAPGKVFKPKRTCCRSGPRCKRCPVAMKRLSRRGLAEKRKDGTYVILELVSKHERKLARKR